MIPLKCGWRAACTLLSSYGRRLSGPLDDMMSSRIIFPPLYNASADAGTREYRKDPTNGHHGWARGACPKSMGVSTIHLMPFDTHHLDQDLLAMPVRLRVVAASAYGCTSGSGEFGCHADGLGVAGRIAAVQRCCQPDQLPAPTSECGARMPLALAHLIIYLQLSNTSSAWGLLLAACALRNLSAKLCTVYRTRRIVHTLVAADT